MWILAKTLAVLTRHDRYFPEIKWSSGSWTHNVFRVYESVFGRRCGIRAEITTIVANGQVYSYAHSWEGGLALTEQYVRSLVKELKSVRVFVPVFMTPQGIPIPASPYLFAIAFDAASAIQNGSAPTVTWSHTVTGSDPLIAIGGGSGGTTDNWTTVTYNLSALTLASKIQTPSDVWVYIFLLGNPATGANNAIVSAAAGNMNTESVSYSGAQSSSTADAIGSGTTGNQASVNGTVTTVADNCWSIMVAANNNQTINGGTSTNRAGTGQFQSLWDTNSAKTPAGLVTLNGTCVTSGAGAWGWVTASFAPAGGGGGGEAPVSRGLGLLGVGQ